MPAPPTTHPPASRLVAYGLGRLRPADAEAVEAHLGGCEACGAVLDGPPPDSFVAALRDAAGLADTPTVALADATPADRDPVPSELAEHPRYRVGGLIGRGGMGSVYKAEHTLMGRAVAVKVIAPRLLQHPGAGDRFKQEVRAAARLHHPHIVTAFDAEEVGPVTVLVMEYVEGRSLADVLRDRGPLPVAEACRYAAQAALGLAHAHAAGMVHRDVKPHNLMLAADGRVKILDFGLARFAAEAPAEPPSEPPDPAAPAGITSTGAFMGTLDYMAPEQARDPRAADARADVYALGATLYHLLTGRVPFPGGSGLEKLARLADDDPTPLAELRPDVPPALAAVVARMMARRPEDRTPMAAAAADALTAFADGPAPRRRARTAVLAALVVVAAVAGGAWGLARLNPVPDAGPPVAVTDPPAPPPTADPAVKPAPPPPAVPEKYEDAPAPPAPAPAPVQTPQSPTGPGFLRAPVVPTNLSRALLAHKSAATAVVWHPDGRRLITAGEKNDPTVRVWDVVSEGLARTLTGHAAAVKSAALFPDGKRLATSDQDGTVVVWDIDLGQEKVRFRVGGWVTGLAVSPDGRHLLTSGVVGPAAARLWDADTGAEVGFFPAGSGAEGTTPLAGHRAAFLPSGARAVTAGWTDGSVAVWDVAARREVKRLTPANGKQVFALAVLDENRVAAGGEDGEVRVWDIDRGVVVANWSPGAPCDAVAASRDGRRLAYGCRDAVVRVIDLDTRAESRALSLNTAPLDLAFAPDGRRLAVGWLDGTARVYFTPAADTPTLAEARRHLLFVDNQPAKSPHFIATAFAPTGGGYAAGGDDSLVRVWDGTSAEPRVLRGHTAWISALAYTPNGRRLVSAAGDKTVRVWDVTTGGEVKRFELPAVPLSVAVSPDGTHFLVGRGDGVVSRLNPATGTEVETVAHGDPSAAAFAPDGGSFVTWSGARLRTWDASTGAPRGPAYTAFGPVTGARFADGGRRLLTVGPGGASLRDAATLRELVRVPLARPLEFWGVTETARYLVGGEQTELGARVWDLTTGAEVGRLSLPIRPSGELRSSPDGTQMVSGGWRGAVYVLRFDDPAPVVPPSRVLPGPRQAVGGVAVSPDGATAYAVGADGVVRAWDVAAGRELPPVVGASDPADTLTLSPDGSRLLVAHRDLTVRVWDTRRGVELKRLAGATRSVNAVAFSPDGGRAFAASLDGKVRGWETDTGAKVAEFAAHTGARSIAVLPGGARVLTGSKDGTARLWDAAAGQAVGVYGPFPESDVSVAVSPDGAFGTAVMWNLASATGVRTFLGHAGPVHGAVFTADGSRVAVLGCDGSVRVFETATGRCVAVCGWHARCAGRLAMTPDGRRLVSTGDANDHLRVWDLPAPPLPVAPPPRAVTVRPIPPELDLIPRDAAGFVTVPVGEVMTTPSLAWARQQVFAGTEFAEMVKATTQFDLHEVTRATVVWPTAEHVAGNILVVPPEVPSRVLVLTSSRSIRDRYADYSKHAIRIGEGTEEYRGRRYRLDADGWTALFPADDRTLVVGSRAAVRLVIDRLADPKPGPLDGAVRVAVDRPEAVVLGVNGSKGTGRALAAQLPPAFDALGPALAADRATLVADCRDGMRLEYRGEFAAADDAARAGDALGKASAAGAAALGETLLEYDRTTFVDGKDAERRRERDFIVQTRDALKAARPERTGGSLRISLRTESTFGFANLLPAVPYVLMPYGPMATDTDKEEAPRRDQAVGRALLAYHATHGHFPPPAVLDKAGRPLLSWRVALLPHLGDEAAALHKEFRLDEPWDSPANAKLLDRMPAVLSTDPFRTTYRPRPNSGYRVYTAKGSVFEGPDGRSLDDITDGAAGTILAVRHPEAVPWTRPDELTFDRLPFAAVFADGTVRLVAPDESPVTIRALVTRAGGERVTPRDPPRRPHPDR